VSRPRVLLLCGGASEEHEVSIASAASVLEAVGDRFDLTPMVIDRSGRLLDRESSLRALGSGHADGERSVGDLTTLPRSFDVIFPLLHGPNGEDGTVQGLLRLLGVPHIGSGVLASAVGMDKLMMKRVFAAYGFPQVAFRGVDRHGWSRHRDRILHELEALAAPRFVKPANLGSSVGIGKARNHEETAAALDEALALDRRAIVEEGANGARELEVAVLGNDAPEASPVGEIRYDADFYDYDTKYLEGRAELAIPALIPDDVAERCRELALAAFTAVDAAGLARVDLFYLEATGELLLNEINTMPGFTRTSMYPRLWDAAGLPYDALIERLVDLALEPR
jgi:D-alanine-D-alanine ligase